METKEAFVVTVDLLASNGQRFANYLVDLAVKLLFILILGNFLGILAEFTGNPDWISWIDPDSRLQDYVISYIILLIYYFLMESFTARTIGKFITNTIVVDEFGEKPTTSTILQQTFCRIIPFNQLSFLGNSQGWHDRFSDTFVVKKSALNHAKSLHDDFNQIGISQED